MKAKELMIGDWVMPLKKKLKGIPGKVITIDGGTNVCWIDSKDYSCLVPCSDVERIPLTHEILEKNGFVLKEDEVGMFGVKIAPHYIREDVPFEVFCDGEPFAVWFKDPVNIKYVYELQHALRLCGIDKEIVVC